MSKMIVVVFFFFLNRTVRVFTVGKGGGIV